VTCANAKCGDGFVWTGIESCDDGNLNNGDGCSSTCQLPKCGDGTVDTGEECDDGNTTNGDGCSSTCKLSTCGDGFVDPNESCDLGAANADRPALLVKQGNLQFAVRPIDRGANVVTFYAYGSGSAHTGYEVLQGSRIYFYRDITTGNLNLVFHHGIDFNSSGQSQPPAQVNWTVAGLPSTVVVLVADDTPSELAKSSPTTVAGKWKLQNNSDGGAIGVFPFPGNFTTTIAPTFTGAITSWAWINGDDVQTSFDLTQTVTISAFSTPSACRLNCSIPACGDGILDGGEVCDDGNTTGGDGCAANCTSLN
jgi:cysteine-rich repeat protein